MGAERRDPVQRAQKVRFVVDRLIACGTLRLSDLAIEKGVTDRAAERILKTLALRGLVRAVAGAWVARAVLLHPAPLIAT